MDGFDHVTNTYLYPDIHPKTISYFVTTWCCNSSKIGPSSIIIDVYASAAKYCILTSLLYFSNCTHLSDCTSQRFKTCWNCDTFYIFVSLGGDCKRYSLNNTGPCINGGKLTCKGHEVAHKIKCECPPNARGAFCEEKIEKVNNDHFIFVLFLGPSRHLDHLL